jgi:predicted enzyme related to lactoylglutathione lyase
MPNPVTHFEIYAEDPAALAEFYRNLLGWSIGQAPGINLYMIRT